MSELHTYAPNTMDVVLRSIWEGQVDDIGQPGDVDSPSRNISADEEAYIPLLECLAAAMSSKQSVMLQEDMCISFPAICEGS